MGRVFKSPDCSKAYTAASKAMQSMIDGKYMPMDDLMLEAAKSELAYSTASQMSTLSDAAETSFVNQALKGVPQTYQRDLLARAGKVTVDEVNTVIKKWLMSIFSPETSISAVATSPSKLEDVQKQLETLGFDVTVRHIVAEGEEEEGSDSGSESGSDGAAADLSTETEPWSEGESESKSA